MEAVSQNPFSNILGNIKDSFLVLDLKGNILSFNKSAAVLFLLPAKPGNFFDYLSPSAAEEFNSLHLKLKESVELPISANMHIQSSTGAEFNCNIILNRYSEESMEYVLCTILPEENIIQLKNRSDIKIKTENILSIIRNNEILIILDELKALYPFTFIGREKLRKKIDRLDEYFTIKDNSNIILLANKKYLKNLSLSAKQVEGKNENIFIPSYLGTLYESVNRYAVDSGNCFVTEGIPFPVFQQEGFQNIMIPLSDSQNRSVAIISVTQEASVKKAEKTEQVKGDEKHTLIDGIPFPVLIVDGKGNIRNANSEFCKLFSVARDYLIKSELTSVLSQEFYESFVNFIRSAEVDISFNFNFQIMNEDRKTQNLIRNVRIKKESNSAAKNENYWLILDIAEQEDELENIFKRRGRMFEVLIQKNPHPVFIYNKENLRFLEVNDAALNLYGYTRDEFLQMDLTDLYTHEDIQTLLDSSSNGMKEGVFNGPFRHKKKDGTSVFVEISKTTFSFNGKDAHFNIVHDITRKLDLEVQAQLFKAAFDNSNDLVFITDSSGFISFANQAVSDVLGFARSELVKSSFTSLIVNEERGTVNKSIFQANLKDSSVINAKLKTKDGNVAEIKLTATPVFNYRKEIDSFNIIGGMVFKESIQEPAPVHDIAHGDDSNISSDSVFLSSLFHEILTPMNVILGFVREITESMELLTPEQKEASEIIEQNRTSLLNTMNLLIEYTNIQRNNYEYTPEEINITDVIDNLLKEISEITQARGIEFAYGKISNSLKFISDKHKFQTLLALIIKIITKLSKEKKIYLSAYQYGDDEFVVSIKDNYSELSSALFNNMVALFENDESQLIKDYGISKLNSRLAKNILDLLGGRFTITEDESNLRECGFVFPLEHTSAGLLRKTENEGSDENAFLDELQEQPSKIIDVNNYRTNLIRQQSNDLLSADVNLSESIITTDENVNLRKQQSAVDLSQLSCLYIEDQVDSQILFKVQLKELREIKFAVSFEEALPLLDQHHFDFIVMDINLQGEYNGLDALKIIHKMAQYQTIPIIAVTAYVLPGDREKFITVGFNDFISKPIFRDKMLESLEKIF